MSLPVCSYIDTSRVLVSLVFHYTEFLFFTTGREIRSLNFHQKDVVLTKIVEYEHTKKKSLETEHLSTTSLRQMSYDVNPVPASFSFSFVIGPFSNPPLLSFGQLFFLLFLYFVHCLVCFRWCWLFYLLALREMKIKLNTVKSL